MAWGLGSMRREGGEERSDAGAVNEFGLPENPACPFCDGIETELHSPFGTALTVATYWCRDCRTAFEFVKR